MVQKLFCQQTSAFHHVFQGFIERILPQPGQSMKIFAFLARLRGGQPRRSKS
jgi:hypothetical protein